MECVHLIISGKVQGVFFRHNTMKKADELGLKGYVRNLQDGSVEVVAEGIKENLEELVEFCKNNPGFSKVDDVKVHFEESKSQFNNFEIKK